MRTDLYFLVCLLLRFCYLDNRFFWGWISLVLMSLYVLILSSTLGLSTSRFQVYRGQRPAAKVQLQRRGRWAPPGPVDWGESLWVLGKTPPITRTTRVCRPPSATCGRTSASKSKTELRNYFVNKYNIKYMSVITVLHDLGKLVLKQSCLGIVMAHMEVETQKC